MAHLQHILIGLEPVLVLLFLVAFLKSGSLRRLPALAAYLAIRAGSAFVLEGILWGHPNLNCGTTRYSVYFYSYWISYIACAVAIFFVIHEVFCRVMGPVPGLRRLGLLAFRWISIVSVTVSVGAIALPAATRAAGSYFIGLIGLNIMRCVSILELCMLAFLALTIHALGRSYRSRLFGIALGFGVEAATDLVKSALLARNIAFSSPAEEFAQIVTTLVLLTWTAYFLIPEPATEHKLIVLPPSSIMARWNGLANGLGHTPEIAMAEPTGFFLQDIEGVVDRVLAKNPVTAHR